MFSVYITGVGAIAGSGRVCGERKGAEGATRKEVGGYYATSTKE